VAEKIRRILVADDETIIADTLAAILRRAGFEVFAVYGGVDAVAKAQELRPELVISDVMMADMNGIDAAIEIRKLVPGTKILLFSGHAATSGLLDKARAEGHDFSFLSKPVHPKDLLDALTKVSTSK
jgi:CheY-like chemotaxis protein